MNQSTLKGELVGSPGESVGSHLKTEHLNAPAAPQHHATLCRHTLIALLVCI